MPNFEKLFSPMARRLTPSLIREVLKQTKEKDVISMAAGMPNPKSFPITMIDDLISESLQHHGNDMLQYGTTMGVKGLRRELCQRMEEKYNIEADIGNVLITTGSLQGDYLIARAFLHERDPVVVGAPTFVAAINAFKNFSKEIVSIPVDDDGMQIEKLEAKIEAGFRPKLVYTIPTFQNPTGTTMNVDRRKRLLDLASDYDFLIIEDAPYNELRYRGKPIATIKSMDTDDRVLFVSTFSKILAPGIRLGWVVGPEECLRKLETLKQPIDACTSAFCQFIGYKFLESRQIDTHIDRLRDLYGSKQAVILESLEEYMPSEVSWTHPKGGMFIWITFPPSIDTQAMFTEALEKHVAYVPGHAFFLQHTQKNMMRLNFTYVEDEKIRKGIKILSEIIKNKL